MYIYTNNYPDLRKNINFFVFGQKQAVGPLTLRGSILLNYIPPVSRGIS